MVDLAREAFSTNNFSLAADIYERTIRENGPTSELFLGLADSLARVGLFNKAFESYTNAYRYGKVTPGKLKHLVAGLIDIVKQDIPTSGNLPAKSSMFSCGSCRGLFIDPVTIPCGHTFCRKCLVRDTTKTCEICNTVHYRLKSKQIKSNVVLCKLVEKWFPDECKASKLKEEGNLLFSKMDYSKAIGVYCKAIEMAPDDHLLFSNRCHAYASLDRFEEALKDAECVVKLRPDWPKGYFRRGTALFGLGKYEDAAVAFLQCLALDQKVSSAKDYLSKTLDKILGALPPDDPKAYSLAQTSNPTLLRQLVESNFSRKGMLLSREGLGETVTQLARIVKDTISTASSFTSELEPHGAIRASSTADDHCVVQRKEEPSQDDHDTELEDQLSSQCSCTPPDSDSDTQLHRHRSMPDCSSVDHDEIKEKTLPRTHSPLSRKRSRIPSAVQCPLSPSHLSPNKILKPTEILSTRHITAAASTITNVISPIATSHQTAASTSTPSSSSSTTCPTSETIPTTQPVESDVEDLECGLCYRLFFEPVTPQCGHTFCRKCLDRCLDHSVCCPICKGDLSEYLAQRRRSVTDAIQSVIEHYFKKEYAERSKINDEEMTELAKMGSQQQSEIPVFVCTLAFPTVVCKLHIFEPRYRLMVRQCMESGTRQFGMCMHTDENEYSDYGVMLEIRDVQYFPDGRSVLDLIGGRRFKVMSRGRRDGYDTAKVQFLQDVVPEDQDVPEINTLQTELHALMTQWVNRLTAVHQSRVMKVYGPMPELDLQTFGPHGPEWTWWAIAVLPLDKRTQLTLLRMPCLKNRLVMLKMVLKRINRSVSQ